MLDTLFHYRKLQKEKFHASSQKGQTLIEVIVGLTAATAVMAAITVAALSSLNNAQFGRNQNLANDYARQGMEIVNNLQLTDYTTFSNLSGIYCFAQSCNALDGNILHTGQPCALLSGSNCPVNIGANFVRKVTFDTNAYDSAEAAKCNTGGSIDNTKVVVEVDWNDQKCTDHSNLYCHNVTLSSCFNNAEVIPTPGTNPTP